MHINDRKPRTIKGRRKHKMERKRMVKNVRSTPLQG